MQRKVNMKLCEGEAMMRDGTKITVENNMIRKINDCDVYGLSDIMLNQCDFAEFKSYDSDVVIITTDTRAFRDVEAEEKEWSKIIGKKVVLMPDFYNPHNIYTEIFEKLNKIEKDIEIIKKEKDGNK